MPATENEAQPAPAEASEEDLNPVPAVEKRPQTRHKKQADDALSMPMEALQEKSEQEE